MTSWWTDALGCELQWLHQSLPSTRGCPFQLTLYRPLCCSPSLIARKHKLSPLLPQLCGLNTYKYACTKHIDVTISYLLDYLLLANKGRGQVANCRQGYVKKLSKYLSDRVLLIQTMDATDTKGCFKIVFLVGRWILFLKPLTEDELLYLSPMSLFGAHGVPWTEVHSFGCSDSWGSVVRKCGRHRHFPSIESLVKLTCTSPFYSWDYVLLSGCCYAIQCRYLP